LASLIRNVIPEQHFSLQHTLSNKMRVDCILWLPEPTGNIVIDAKFPLENYRLLTDTTASEAQRSQADAQFKKDIRNHIKAISEKYIIEGETADGAIMFIPAEAVFAEIHSRHPDIVEASHRAKVWMVSPTTMMAILTTARAVLKDTATRQQLNIIQEHLRLLADDFRRFQKRMDSVATHIAKAHTEVDDVQISARKITARFGQIEQVELESIATETLPPPVPVAADDN
jgi:DNA recombination protein RmuC